MANTITFKKPDQHGYYGQFGGAYIPEMLYKNVQELQQQYLDIIYDPAFQDAFYSLLRNYV
ncbi:MAG: tryptophan synthase subunit beta, partial [Phycisphaerae bacterium]